MIWKWPRGPFYQHGLVITCLIKCVWRGEVVGGGGLGLRGWWLAGARRKNRFTQRKKFARPMYKLVLWSFPMFRDVLFQIKLHLLSAVLLSAFQSSPVALKSTVRQYLVNFKDLAGIVNTAVHKTEPISTGLRHDLQSNSPFYWGGLVPTWLLNQLKHWVINSPPPGAEYMHQSIRSALVQIMACHLYGAKPLSKQMLGHFQSDPQEQTSIKF